MGTVYQVCLWPKIFCQDYSTTPCNWQHFRETFSFVLRRFFSLCTIVLSLHHQDRTITAEQTCLIEGHHVLFSATQFDSLILETVPLLVRQIIQRTILPPVPIFDAEIAVGQPDQLLPELLIAGSTLPHGLSEEIVLLEMIKELTPNSLLVSHWFLFIIEQGFVSHRR